MKSQTIPFPNVQKRKGETCTWTRGGLKRMLYTLPLDGWIQRWRSLSFSVSRGMLRLMTTSSSQALFRASAWARVRGKPRGKDKTIKLYRTNQVRYTAVMWFHLLLQRSYQWEKTPRMDFSLFSFCTVYRTHELNIKMLTSSESKQSLNSKRWISVLKV